MTKNYDIVVVGGGTSGEGVALSAAKAGKSTAIIEGRDYGGTCPLRGCDPKLVLHAAAETTQKVRRLQGKGFQNLPDFSWHDLMEWKTTFTEPVPPQSREKLTDAGVDVYDEYATFVDAHTLDVAGERVKGETIILATGQKPAPLDIPGKEHLLTSDDFLSMPDLPKEVLFIGGGYIGAESAHISHALGAKVTLIVSEEVPLDKFDHDLARLLLKSDRERGMTVHVNSKAAAVRKVGDRYEVDVKTEDGQTTLTTDRAFHCAGRVPNIAELDLDNAGVDYDKSAGIKVDDYLRTNQPHIYAIGDCCDSGLPLTPVATYALSKLTGNLFEGKNDPVDYYPIPTVSFCLPGMASVGMTEREAQESDRRVKTYHKEATDFFHAHHTNASVMAYKVFVDEETGQILGVHLLGPDMTELINLCYLAIKQEMTAEGVKDLIFGYPTAASVFQDMLSD